MLLAIDVSNTHTKVGVYEGDRLARHWRLQTEPERTADEYGVMLLGLFRSGGVSPEAVTVLAGSSAFLDMAWRGRGVGSLLRDRPVVPVARRVLRALLVSYGSLGLTIGRS